MTNKQLESLLRKLSMNKNRPTRELLIDDKRDLSANRVCRNYFDGIAALQEELWDVLWLDYDLGVGCYTGQDVLTWLESNLKHLPLAITCISSSDHYRTLMQEKANAMLIAAQQNKAT